MSKKCRREATTRQPKRVSYAARARMFLRRNRLLLRSWLIFMSALGVLHGILEMAGARFWEPAKAWTAQMLAWTLNVLGADGAVHGTLVTSDVFNVTIIGECTAIHPILIYTAAVLAYPCRLRSKLLGVGLGIPTILLINVVRLVSLCYIGGWYPTAFDTAHMLVWQSLIIFLTVLLWIVWALTFVGRDEIRSA